MSNVVAPKEGHVFVATYGSLRRKMQNFDVNEGGGGKFFAKGATVNNYNLYRFSNAYFPSVSLEHNSNGKPVVVDVFQVPQKGLTGAYDRLEGYYGEGQDNFYNRSLVEVLLDNGDSVSAWIYWINEEQPELIESGDWCLHNIPNYYEELEKV